MEPTCRPCARATPMRPGDSADRLNAANSDTANSNADATRSRRVDSQRDTTKNIHVVAWDLLVIATNRACAASSARNARIDCRPCNVSPKCCKSRREQGFGMKIKQLRNQRYSTQTLNGQALKKVCIKSRGYRYSTWYTGDRVVPSSRLSCLDVITK